MKTKIIVLKFNKGTTFMEIAGTFSRLRRHDERNVITPNIIGFGYLDIFFNADGLLTADTEVRVFRLPTLEEFLEETRNLPSGNYNILFDKLEDEPNGRSE